jgi:hypothetical protein
MGNIIALNREAVAIENYQATNDTLGAAYELGKTFKIITTF